MVRPEFPKIENKTKTGKGENIFSEAKRKFLDQNSSRSKTKRISKEGKLFFAKRNEIFLPELPKIENVTNQKGKQILFIQAKRIVLV
jgi:hypothetical protein